MMYIWLARESRRPLHIARFIPDDAKVQRLPTFHWVIPLFFSMRNKPVASFALGVFFFMRVCNTQTI